MKKIKNILIFLAICMFLTAPVISMAAGLVPCDNSPGQPCDFNALMALIYKVIKFILFDLAIPIAAIMFAYAGALLFTAGGESSHARDKAKKIFWGVSKGLIFAAGAFLIVRAILSIAGFNGSWIGF